MKSKFELRFRGSWEPEKHYSKSFVTELRMTGTKSEPAMNINRDTLQEWGLPENVWSNNKLVVEIRCESKVLWRKSFNEKCPGWYDMFAPHPIGWERISGRPMSWPYWELGWRAYNFLDKEWEIWVNGCKANVVVTNPFATEGYVMMYTDEGSNYWRDAKPTKPGKKSIKAVLDISNPNGVVVVPEEYVGYNNPGLPPKMFTK